MLQVRYLNLVHERSVVYTLTNLFVHFSADGWCGNSDKHCTCKGCKDFRVPQVDGAGDSSDEEDHTTPQSVAKTTPEPRNKKTKGQAVKVCSLIYICTQHELYRSAEYVALYY